MTRLPLLLAACDAGDTCLREPMKLTCRLGEDALGPLLVDGATATLAAGPAGGAVLSLSFEARYSRPIVHAEVAVSSARFGEVERSPTTYVRLSDAGICTGIYNDLDTFMFPGPEVICALDGDTVHVRLDVTDPTEPERTASCEADVVVALDSAYSEFCG